MPHQPNGIQSSRRSAKYFWERSKWVKPMEVEGPEGKRPRRKYSREQVRKIEALWTAYQEGYTPQQAYERANVGEILRHPQLTALFNASRQMVRSALYEDLAETLYQVAKSVAENLNSEVCSIFLLSESKPNHLELAAQSGGKEGYKPAPIEIASVLGGGLTGHIAATGRPFRDHGPKLRSNEYATGRAPQHLNSQVCFSLLAVPIEDRKGRLVGLLKLENKARIKVRPASSPTVDDSHEWLQQLLPPGDDVYFTEADETLAKILANDIVFTLETFRLTRASRSLLEKLNKHPSLEEFFSEVLDQVRRLTGADRGDIIWPDEDQQALCVRATTSAGTLKPGDVIPHASIARLVIDTGKKQSLSHVSGVQNYFPCDPRTSSEAAVPVLSGDPPQTLGVLNAEWFQENDFDSDDEETLEHLANFVALGAKVIESEEHEETKKLEDLQTVIAEMHSQRSSAGVLRTVLCALVPEHFDRARIFKYLPDDKAFECLDSMGVEEDGAFKRKIIRAADSRYAKDTIETWSTNASASERDPNKSGPDPYANELNKSANMKWAVAPLVVMGELFGYIAADNAKSRRAIRPKHLKRMDLFTTLTAQSIVNLTRSPERQ